MASFDDNSVPAMDTTFFVGSWCFVADGSSSFNSHMIDPRAPEVSKAARRRTIDDFVDHLDEIPLPVHVKEVRKHPDFDVTAIKSPFELVEDLDNLLEITRPDIIVKQEIMTLPLHQDTKSTGEEIATITIENYLKDLVAILCPRVDNSDLLSGIDRVSYSITDCISLAKSSLHNKKSGFKP